MMISEQRQSSGMKCCTGCFTWKQASAEYFHRDSTKGDGLYPRCRVCRRGKKNPRSKTPLTPDQIEAKKKERLARKRKERDLRNQRNPEKYQAELERKREAQKQRRLNNPRRYIEASKLYRQRFPEKTRLNSRIQRARRRSKMHELPTCFTKHDWEVCLEHFNYCCAYCGVQRDFWHTLEIDHYIPVTNSNCPGHVPTNIVPSCKSCNTSKQNKNPEQWILERLGARKGRLCIDRIKSYFDWVGRL
jgi:hypothetical protein